MQPIQELFGGFVTIFTPELLMWCLIGVLLGTIAGALPVVQLRQWRFYYQHLVWIPLSALLFLMGIYQGAMYGGRISSILLNVPGDAPAVVTTFDGYPMTQQGRAGYALTLSAFASFVGGTIGFIGLVFLTAPIAGLALVFGSPEYFALMVFALIATSGLVGNRPLKPLIAMLIGVIIAVVGADPVMGTERFMFGFFNFGMVLISSLLELLAYQKYLSDLRRNVLTTKTVMLHCEILFPKFSEIMKDFWTITRSSLIGFLFGALPGAGATITTFIVYDIEKKLSKKPEEFGKGATKGLSGPEAASNATVGGALIPLFSLGIPGSGTTAILLGALMMLGLQPGPRMFQESGEIIWATIAGLFLANILLLIVNTAFVPLLATMIRKINTYLNPIIAVLCIIGIYMLNNSLLDVGLMIFFGLLGYILRKYNFPLAPLVLAVILAPMLEENFTQSLLMSSEGLNIFVTRPISLIFLLMSATILLIPLIKVLMKRKKIRGLDM
ncbi:LOW QUALITY PROTEIN: tricarboxylate transport membrane protein TctA [Geomicrobium sp. JCM 19055]|nr:LOW QUALITY PROTEIN: tricarboxylate transport membrane protein TctA [Geomicrobium sp. JCM 19055]